MSKHNKLYTCMPNYLNKAVKNKKQNKKGAVGMGRKRMNSRASCNFLAHGHQMMSDYKILFQYFASVLTARIVYPLNFLVLCGTGLWSPALQLVQSPLGPSTQLELLLSTSTCWAVSSITNDPNVLSSEAQVKQKFISKSFPFIPAKEKKSTLFELL